MDPSFSKRHILNFRHKESQREERLPLHIGHVVRQHLERTDFHFEQSTIFRKMESEEELIQLPARDKLKNSYIETS